MFIVFQSFNSIFDHGQTCVYVFGVCMPWWRFSLNCSWESAGACSDPTKNEKLHLGSIFREERDLLSQGAFDLFLVLECVDACTSVNSDVSDWSHGFCGDDFTHSKGGLMWMFRKWAIRPARLPSPKYPWQKYTRLVIDLYILVMRSILASCPEYAIFQTIGVRSNVESPSVFTATPFSVTMAVTNSAGVTSKLGL